MKKHKSALGKIVDMAALAAKNEKVRAVGNMKVNARGDTIDGHGRVIVPVNKKVNDGYAKTVSNKSAQVAKPNQAPNKPKQELTVDEQIIEDSFEEDLEIEKIRSKESKK